MATRIGARLPYRVFKDSGDVCTDATITFYLANTTTLQAVYSDKELTSSLGSSVSCNSVGVVPDIWVSDAISLKAVIAGSGVTSDTIDYLTVAASTVAGTTSGDFALGNAIVNGGLSAWTPGTSYSNISGSGTGVEVADDIYFVQSTAASNSITRQTANGTQARYAMRVGRPAGSTSTNKLRIWGTIPTDEAYRLRGQEVTFSFRVKAGATFSGTALGVRLATGTTEAESGDLIEASGFAGHANPLNTTQAITTTATRYEFTCTLSATLKNLGWQLAYTGVSTAGATDFFEVEDLQIEIASAATSFKVVPEPLDYLRANLTTGGRLVAASTFTDPGADRVLGWDDSAGAVIGFTFGTGIATNGTAIELDADLVTWAGVTPAAGIATFLATPSSANLAAAMTDEAGTGALYFTGGALGTPASGVLTNATGLPISTGVSGLGTGVATFLATPSSANLISAVTDETGSGALVFATSPTLVTPILGTPTSGTLTNCTLPVGGLTGLGTGVATFLATPSASNLVAAVTGGTVWHSGNDGAGSGLDADLLDGLSSAAFYQVSGTDVALADGGTGASLADPNADRIMFWDDSAGAVTWLSPGTASSTGIEITTTNIALNAAGVLANLLTVDGAGSGLDADLLDGQSSAYYLAASSYTAADVLSKLLTVDGAGSGLDADLLDGKNIGTSGNTVPLLDGANTWSAEQLFDGGVALENGDYLKFLSTGNNSIRVRNNGTLLAFDQYTTGGVYSATVLYVAFATGVFEFLNTPTVGGNTVLTTATGAQLAAANTFTAEQSINVAAYGRVNFKQGGTSLWTIGPRDTTDYYLYRESGSGNIIHVGGDTRIEAAPTALATNSAGFRGCPATGTPNSAYTMVIGDAGGQLYHDEVTARTWTIPANSSVAYPIGTTIVLDNTGNSGSAGTITLSITTDTLRRGDGTSGTGSRTIAANQVAVIRKVASTVWTITGTFS